MRDLGSLAFFLVVTLQLYGQQQVVSAAGTGFIRAVDGNFVDEECNDFVATGLNT